MMNAESRKSQLQAIINILNSMQSTFRSRISDKNNRVQPAIGPNTIHRGYGSVKTYELNNP